VQFFFVLAVVSADFESENHADSQDWYTSRIEAEQNGCQVVRSAQVWTEFHLGIPAESTALFEGQIPQLQTAAAQAINDHCSDIAAHCPAEIKAADICILPEPVGRRLIEGSFGGMARGIKAIFIVGTPTIKAGTSIKKYLLSERFVDDMVAAMISADISNEHLAYLTVYDESIQVKLAGQRSF
jgi:hypothetical protein